MESKDIIKALECCKKMKCAKCPFTEVINCKNKLIKKALNLLCVKEASIVSLQAVKEHQQAEIERLTVLAELGSMRANDYRAMRDKCKTAKTEAYKEFADRLRQHKVYSDNVRFKGNVVDCIWITDILQELTEKGGVQE